MDTPTPQTPIPQIAQTSNEKSDMKSQVRALERELRERTQSRFPGNPLGVDVLATDLALRSSQLVLEATSMHKTVARATNRRGRDAKKLQRAGIS